MRPFSVFPLAIKSYNYVRLGSRSGDSLAEKMALYKDIHKGQRRWLFDISNMAARLDFADKGQIEMLQKEIKAFLDHLIEHVDNEEKSIHPILNERVPGCPRAIAAEHKIIHKDVEDILASLEVIRKISSRHEANHAIGYEIYLAWNRFISVYLRHIDTEEGYLQRALLSVCSAEELGGIFRTIMTSTPPQSMMVNLRIMTLGLNDDELSILLNGAKSMMPPEAFNNATSYMASLLEPERWSRISARIGR
jgi:hemerythrin-like domain-containing protein